MNLIEKFRQRRHNSAPHHQHNRGTSGRDGDKYYDQHRDIQSNYQHRHRPSLQHHRSASLGDRRVEEVLHKPDHETSAPARQHPNYKQHYYINKSSSSKSPSAAPISTPPVHNQPPPSPSLRRTSSPLAVSENRHVKKPSSSSTPSHSNSNRPSPPAGYHNHHYPHHATQQQHPQQQQKSGAYVYNQSCTDARRRAEMLRAESTRSAYAATPPSPYVVPTHQRHLSNTAMSYPIVPVILMAPTPPPHGKSNSYTGIHGNDSGASWMMPTTVPANNFK
ncbi:hypothetical protein BDB00DRAFT_448531 [Zychaea mexicana]|uniref:uncharacterized protein n=1 Tax=Zychaea mexicana TaxID=64656 RepID=UPI0022FECC67|nr:uncharacterized protein BDB00DRAFT_448531 [Zychaea mexicana]KAI9498435.1 hypothetical protein BDB00DRAFT_448531 [Zychaea mexicana]